MMTNNDKNRLRSLMERYDYKDFVFLNESFQSSTLAKLIDINKRDHIGLSGKKEEALSPIGADFLMTFPIHWDKVPEKNVKLVINPRVKQHSPRQEENFDKNLNKYSWAKSNDERTNFKLSSYVSTEASDDDARDMFVKYSGRLKREIDYLEKIKKESERGAFSGWDLRVLSQYKKDAKLIVDDIDKLREAYNVLYWMTQPSVSKDKSEFITNYDPKKLKDLHRSIGEDRFISVIDAAKKYFKDHDGKTPEEVMRTREDYLDNFGSIRDLKYPKIDDLLDLLKDKKYIDESSIRELKRVYVDRFKNEYITTQRRIVWMLNKIKSLGVEKSDTEFVKDSKNPNDFNNKMISLYKELIAKSVGEKSEVGDLLQLYINAESAGDNARTKVKTYIDTILSGFSSDGDNDDNYKIAVLTDVKFKILYIVSNMKLDDIGFKPTSVLYGWEEGMSPKIYETPVLTPDGQETKKRQIVYDFTKYIDMDYIKEDDRVRCAFFVTGRTNNSDVLKSTKDIEKLNAKLKKVLSSDDSKSLSSTDFDTNGIESKDMDDVKALFDKYELPYEIKDGKLYCAVNSGNALEDNNLVRVLGIIGQSKLDKGLIRKWLDDIRSATVEIKKFEDVKKYNKDDFDEYYRDRLDSLDFVIKGKKVPYKKWLGNTNKLKDENGNPLFADTTDSLEKRKYYDEVYVGGNVYNTILGNMKTAKQDLEDYVTAHNKYVRLYLKTTSNYGGGDDIRFTQALKKTRDLSGNTRERMANRERKFKKSPLANLDTEENDPKKKEVDSFVKDTNDDINYIESTSPKPGSKGGYWYDIFDTVIKTTPEFDILDIPQFYSRFILRITNILRAYQNLAKRYPNKLDIMKDRAMQIKDGYANLVGNITGILSELEPDVLRQMGKVKKPNEYTERIADMIMDYTKLLEDARYEIDKIKTGN